ncbi:MAG TPA: hypothetical protein DEQ01_00350, partial [Thermoanaerobacter sp.]|nr:hypothetical protein [Thermoanaerobacter sp.]
SFLCIILAINIYYRNEVRKMIIVGNTLYYAGKFSTLLFLLKELNKKYKTLGEVIKSAFQ